MTRNPLSTTEARPAYDSFVAQRAAANHGVSAREVEQLDQIVGLGMSNPDMGAWLMRFPHLILSLIGLPMPRSFATLLCAPDLASLKDLAMRSVALIDDVGIPDGTPRRDRFEGGSMADIWAY